MRVNVQAWANAINMVADLGVPIVKLIGLVRESLPPDQADLVLAGLRQGWADAKTENDARIAELEASIAAK